VVGIDEISRTANHYSSFNLHSISTKNEVDRIKTANHKNFKLLTFVFWGKSKNKHANLHWLLVYELKISIDFQ